MPWWVARLPPACLTTARSQQRKSNDGHQRISRPGHRANRGTGRAFARALIEHGAAKVYAGVRDPAATPDRNVTPLRLDVTRPDEIAEATAVARDVTIVINNAGIGSTGTGLLNGTFDAARQAMEVNHFGTWAVSRAFAPILARNGGDALVNTLSLASWVGQPSFPGYAAAKAAQWSQTDALRQDLREQGTLLTAPLPGRGGVSLLRG
ncbi:SDR family NAD(P)-dependent oxidoreductase [Streptomyces sp. NPDC002133]|uniref:SDR family NAD(P)-dependent oxidoreductase n=1 Tax=Streptomyces sp. NPDC002133 TaxID=3154409 RepID=UPI0033208615